MEWLNVGTVVPSAFSVPPSPSPQLPRSSTSESECTTHIVCSRDKGKDDEIETLCLHWRENGSNVSLSDFAPHPLGVTPREGQRVLKVKAISCGGFHAAVVLSTGSILTWGKNNHLQLGRRKDSRDDVFHLQPQPVEALSRVTAIQIHCGEEHTIAVTEANEVYSWGRNDYGQLGRGKCDGVVGRISSLPCDVKKTVYVGVHHNAIIYANELYTFGWGLYGQLGHGTTTNEFYPKKVRALNGVGRILQGGARFEDVAAAACGAWHTVAVSVTGDVYAFGWNKYGQVDPCTRKAEFPIYLPKLVDLKDQALCNKKASDVSVGFRHTLIRFTDLSFCIYGKLWIQSPSLLSIGGLSSGGAVVDAGFYDIEPKLVCIARSGKAAHCTHHVSHRWCSLLRILKDGS